MPVVINEFEVVAEQPAAPSRRAAAAAASRPRSRRRRRRSDIERIVAARARARARACARTERAMADATPASSAGAPDDRVDGQDKADLAGGAARPARCIETVDGLYRCEATFGNWGDEGRQHGLPVLRPRRCSTSARHFAVKLGDDDAVRRPHHRPRGAVSRRARRRELAVLAEDRLQDLRMTRRTRTFADVSDADVMQPDRQRSRPDAAASTSAARRTRCSRRSTRATSRSCASARARRRRAVGRGHARCTSKPRAQRDGGDRRSSAYGDELREFSVLADLAASARASRVSGWDVVEQERDHARGDRVGDQRRARAATTSGVEHPADRRSATRKEALAHARAARPATRRRRAPRRASGMRARRFVIGRGVAETDARAARRRARSTLAGLGPLFSGKYYVAEVRHLLRRRERPAHRVRGRAARARAGRDAMHVDIAARRRSIDERLPSGLRRPLVRRLPGAGHRHQGPGRPGPRQGHAAVVARHRRRALRGLGAAGDADGRQQPRQLVRARRQRRGAGRLRGRRPAPALRDRRAVERQRHAAGVDGRRRQQLQEGAPLAQRREGHARRQDGQETVHRSRRRAARRSR